MAPNGHVTRLATFPRRRTLVSLAVAVLACVLVGASASVFTAAGLEPWYGSLERPALAPPNWVFGPVWTGLFILMGVAAWLVWRTAAGPDARPPASRSARSPSSSR